MVWCLRNMRSIQVICAILLGPNVLEVTAFTVRIRHLQFCEAIVLNISLFLLSKLYFKRNYSLKKPVLLYEPCNVDFFLQIISALLK